MKTLRTAILPALILATVACGYSSKMSAPVPGTMPTITQLSPTSTRAGSAAFTLTINGSNFMNTAVVNWNQQAQPAASTTFVSAGQLTLAVPASAIATAGTIQISVTNPATQGTGQYGSGGTTAVTSTSVNFTIN
ncbi:MAG TPA: IPT/TIG domain-containing protein [Candidatus Sulfotelmatobacter sp.]|nr:IPT/TIG domain-containing protein [Candidatus Sulfotelmatobacter sp.]